MLQIEQESYQALVENICDYAIVLLDKNGHMISWNKGAEQLYGYTENEVIGRHVSLFYPIADVENDVTGMHWKQAIAAGQREYEEWRLRKDRSQFWANVVLTPLQDSNGVLTGFGEVTRDQTVRKVSEK